MNNNELSQKLSRIKEDPVIKSLQDELDVLLKNSFPEKYIVSVERSSVLPVYPEAFEERIDCLQSQIAKRKQALMKEFNLHELGDD